ncbi:MAG: tetratricopeptide repeat protein [Bacteroidales bacterium]|nr:tetratricopeptide repeat protein [Bacteroidales bacterium]
MDLLKNKSSSINLFFHCHSSERCFLNDDELLGYLSGLKLQGINVNSENDIKPGDEEIKTIIRFIEESRILVLIVSQFWLDSDFVTTHLFPIIEKKFKDNKLEIIPVLAYNCSIDDSSWFRRLNFFPPYGLSIYSDFNDHGRKNNLYKSIREEIVKRANFIREIYSPSDLLNIKSKKTEIEELIKIGQNKLARFYLESLLRTKVSEDEDTTCSLLIETGKCQQKTGAQTAAYQNYINAFNIAKKNNNKTFLSLSLSCIGNIFKEQGNLREAIKYYEKSLALIDITNIIAKCNLKINLGSTYRRIGNFDLATTLISESTIGLRELAIYEKNEDEKNKINRHLGIALGSLSSCNISSNDYISALKHAEEGLSLSLKYDNLRGIGYAKHRIAQVYLALKFPVKALPLLKEASNIAKEADEIREIFSISLSIGQCYFQLGQIEDAERFFFSAMMDGVSTSDFFRIAQSHEWIATMRSKNGQETYYYYEVAKRLYKLVEAKWWAEKIELLISSKEKNLDDNKNIEIRKRVSFYIDDLLSKNIITREYFEYEAIAKIITP